MNWTEKEITQIHAMLFSADEDNRLLGLELIENRKNTNPFITALSFVQVMEEDNDELNNKIYLLFSGLASQIRVKKWKELLEFYHKLWDLDKKQLLTALENLNPHLTTIEAFIKLAPHYSSFLYHIGKQLMQEHRQIELGHRFLLKAIECNPQDSNAHFDYAYSLSKSSKNVEIAVYHYEQCLVTGLDELGVYHNLGKIELAYLLEDSSPDGTRELLEEILTQDPTNHLAYNNLAFLLWHFFKEYELAKKHIQKALEYKPKEGLYWHTLAEIEYYGLKNKLAAIVALEEAIKIDPKYKGAREMIKELNDNSPKQKNCFLV